VTRQKGVPVRASAFRLVRRDAYPTAIKAGGHIIPAKLIAKLEPLPSELGLFAATPKGFLVRRNARDERRSGRLMSLPTASEHEVGLSKEPPAERSAAHRRKRQ
jgi:hypothetical protein